MTGTGWTLLILTWGILFGILFFCYGKVLSDDDNDSPELDQ